MKSPGHPLHSRFLQKVAVLMFVVVSFVFYVILPDYMTRESSYEQDTAGHEGKDQDGVTQSPRDLRDKLASKTRTKKILAWTKIFSKDFLIYHKHKVIASQQAFSACPVYKDCEWTIDRSEIQEADSVLFHIFPQDFSLDDLPDYRTNQQNWIFFNLESPMRFQGM